MTIAEAIADFRVAADTKGDGSLPASQDRALHARMARAFLCLKSHGQDGLVAFASLLDDASTYVRIWVAAQLLSEGERSAVPVMKQLASEPGLLGFTAATTLTEFRAGRLHSLFATPDT